MDADKQIELVSRSAEQTQEFGRRLAGRLAGGQVIALIGHLGAGKTQWVKGLALGLGLDPDAVHSPTFTLINEYGPAEVSPNQSPQAIGPFCDGACPGRQATHAGDSEPTKSSLGLLLYHVDVYRLGAASAAAELEAIGFGEIIAAGDGLVAVEWADRVAELIPPDAVWIEGSMPSGLGPDERHYRIRARDAGVLDQLVSCLR